MNWPYILKGEYMWLNPMIVFNSSSSMFEKKKNFIQRLKFCRYLYHPVWVTISGLHALSRWHFPNPNGRVSWTTNNSVQFITVINWEHCGKQRLIFVKNNLPKSLQETGRVGWGWGEGETASSGCMYALVEVNTLSHETASCWEAIALSLTTKKLSAMISIAFN